MRVRGQSTHHPGRDRSLPLGLLASVGSGDSGASPAWLPGWAVLLIPQPVTCLCPGRGLRVALMPGLGSEAE